MDRHVTQRDRDIYELGTHRYLRQDMAPPCPQHYKKKKLVNFKVSLRRRPSKEQARRSSTGSIILPQPEGRKSSVTFLEESNALESLRESRETGQPLPNDVRNVEREASKTTQERREAFRSTGEQRMSSRRSCDKSGSTVLSLSPSRDQDFRSADEAYQDASQHPDGDEDEELNHATQNLSFDTHRRSSPIEPTATTPRTTPRSTPRTTPTRTTPDDFPEDLRDLEAFQRRKSGFSRSSSMSSTENWNKVRSLASTPRTSRMNSLVETLITRRKASLAPSIWTPSVPRLGPGPRPANFQNQEERGKGNYIISFIAHASPPPKPRPHVRFRRMTSVGAPLPERETRSKEYMTWLAELVANPLLSSGTLLKGLEIGVQFPVIHLREVPEGGVGGGEQRRLEASLGGDSSLLQGEYEEMVAWVPELLVTCPSDPSQWARCFIVLGFMTLDGELNEKMEKVWKEWTGALFIYCNIDDDLGLKKLSFLRRRSPHQSKLFSYLVIVEIDTVTHKNSLHLLDFVYRMRLRSMSGYISVYQSHSPEETQVIARTVSPSKSATSMSSSSSSSSAQSERTTVSAILPEYHPDEGASRNYGRMSV